MENQIVSRLKGETECVGCGACIAVCPKNAIAQKKTVLEAWVPVIREDLCVHCGLCKKVCATGAQKNNFDKTAGIVYNQDPQMRKRSASGGVFSALAQYVLDCGGSVFGAEMYFEDGKAVVRHQKITQITELPRLLGSKYVQSDAAGAYQQVRAELQAGRMVLFSGCSCQVAGLKNYLGTADTSNLYTLDLICHGIPSVDLLNSYIDFLSKKYRVVIRGLTFRGKENGRIVFKITLQVEDVFQGGRIKEIQIPIEQSGYYLAFMGQQSYRPACYQCPYASLDKPADLTAGDYFEAGRDYPELFAGEGAIDDANGISSVIVHTDKGRKLLEKAGDYLYFHPVSPLKVQKSHLNLQQPSSASFEREILIRGYKKYGYVFFDRYYRLRERMVRIPRKLKARIKKG